MNEADKLALDHFLTICITGPTIRNMPKDDSSKHFCTMYSWAKEVNQEESQDIFTKHEVRSQYTIPNGEFIYNGDTVLWKMIDKHLIFKRLSTHDKTSPIEDVNRILVEAANNASNDPGSIGTSALLKQLCCIAVMVDRIILIPNKPLLYNAINKRTEKILEAIKVAAPDLPPIVILQSPYK